MMKILLILGVAGLIICGMVCQSSSLSREKADIVLLNGKIYTVESQQPRAQAVALKQEKILYVGSNQGIQAVIGDTTEVIDLQGAMVLPGFIDAHTHFLDGGFALSNIQLRNAKSKDEFIERISQKAQSLDKGEWILNGDWDQQQFNPPEMPNKEWIDAITPENPVCVNRLDGHMVFVNSLALKLAGITKHTPEPAGGVIVKDPKTGEPTGILKDEAINLVTEHIPEPSLEEKKQAALNALNHANSLGITSVHDMAYAANFEVYQALLQEHQLTARLYVYIPISEVDLYSRLKLKTPFGDPFLRIGGLKGFVDGSLGSFTALFLDPYTDDPTKSGIMVADMFPEGIMEQRIRQADDSELQVAIHAIGDKANNIILNIFEDIIRENGARDRRWRIEHAQHLLPEDIKRLGRLGILASVQPYHAIDDGRWAEKKIGAKRAQTTYAFRSLLAAGAKLVCGSDWSVAPLDPILGIYAAVARQTLDGKHPDGWVPEEKISLEDVIQGYTINGAYAEFAEDFKGSIKIGKLADLVVLDRNLFDIPVEEIKDVRVQMTILNGRIIYKR